MQTQSIDFDLPACKSTIKQNWLKIKDEHLNTVKNKADLALVIKTLYQLDHYHIDQQINDWESNQINIDGHLYQSKFSLIN